MKKFILSFVIIASFGACTTTTTTNPDGSITRVSRQDPKIVKAISQAVATAAAQAAIQAIEDQTAKQNGNP